MCYGGYISKVNWQQILLVYQYKHYLVQDREYQYLDEYSLIFGDDFLILDMYQILDLCFLLFLITRFILLKMTSEKQ